MSDRRRLSNRRGALALEFVHADLKYRAHVGFFANGNQPAELFLDSSKPNSAIDAFASDAAILISLLLQRGSSVTEIGHALRRTPNGEAADLLISRAQADEHADLADLLDLAIRTGLVRRFGVDVIEDALSGALAAHILSEPEPAA